MESKNLALRPYLEKVEASCRELDKEKLLQLVMGLARQVKPKDRREYLDVMYSILTHADKDNSDQAGDEVAELLVEIEHLHRKATLRLKSIEDGSYWDDPDEGEWEEYSYYDDHDPEVLTGEQVDEIWDYFSEADRFFAVGDTQSAAAIYGALFALLDEINDDSYLHGMDIELREIRARYVRCVYELHQPPKRVDRVFKRMCPGVDEFGSPRNLPMMQDIIDAGAKEMEGFGDFLVSWSKMLNKHDYTIRRIADLSLEAALLQNGVDGVERYAKKWGEQQPAGLLFWLSLLDEQKDWTALKDGALWSLGRLANSNNRHKVASFLVTAGQHLGEVETVLTGYRERFCSVPNSNNLVELVAEAGRQKKRNEELEAALIFCLEHKKSYHDRGLITKILLMAGRFEEAFTRKVNDKQVRWEENSIGLLYFSSLYLLNAGGNDCVLNHEGLREYADSFGVFFNRFSDCTDQSDAIYLEIVAGLELVALTEDARKNTIQWCHDVAVKRVHTIVSNKHRDSYDDAALVLTALTERMIKAGDKQRASSLLHDHCKVKFSRFTAFRKEVRMAVGRSVLVRFMEGKV